MSDTVQVCPYCRAGFEPSEELMLCPSCGTPHHADCFAENGGCTIFGCAAAPAEEAKISVEPTDLQSPALQAQQQGSYLYGLRMDAQGQPVHVPVRPATPPPPPMPGGGIAPPPPMAMQSYPGSYGMPAAPYLPGYGYSYYAQPKSRVAFVLLAVFLGSVGAHNFYAGYNKKATIQLCLTVFTCFAASIVSWIWAIVEACIVTTDDDGVLLS